MNIRSELSIMVTLIMMEYNPKIKDIPDLIMKEFNVLVSLHDIYEAIYEQEEDFERESRLVQYY